MKLMVVDDHVLFREGLVSLIRGQPGIEVVGEAGNVQEAMDRAPVLNPDVILMDYMMPDGTGVDATRAILGRLPNVKVIFLTISESEDQLLEAIRSGAKGYLLKNLSISQLLAALHSVEHGEGVVSPAMMSRLLEEIARPQTHYLQNHSSTGEYGAGTEKEILPSLTSREMGVLRAIALGESNKEIAARLFISENTVKNHVHNLLEKLNLHNRREAVEFARRAGII